MTKSTKPAPDRIGQLEDELKAAEQRTADMKAERDEAHELVERARQHVEDSSSTIQSWIEAFNMQLDDDGKYGWQDGGPVEQYDRLLDVHNDLAKRWNKIVGEYNAIVAPKDVGRPLAASEAQCAQVLKLRNDGIPLRLIVDETSLGLQTVRTIIGRKDRTDRTSVKRIERLGIDKTELIRAKARKRSRDALPKRINEMLEQGAELIAEAKGLGRAR